MMRWQRTSIYNYSYMCLYFIFVNINHKYFVIDFNWYFRFHSCLSFCRYHLIAVESVDVIFITIFFLPSDKKSNGRSLAD